MGRLRLPSQRLPQTFDEGHYVLDLFKSDDQAEQINYTLRLFEPPAPPSTPIEIPVVAEGAGAQMPITGDIASDGEQQRYSFTLTEDDVYLYPYLALELRDGCVNYRLYYQDELQSSANCDSLTLDWLQAGDYELVVTGKSGDDFDILPYLTDDWPGGGSSAT